MLAAVDSKITGHAGSPMRWRRFAPGHRDSRRSLSSQHPASGSNPPETPSGGYTIQNFHLALCAHLTGITLAARFVCKEVTKPPQDIAHVARFVKDHHHT
jgi:hypothetical protein